MASFRLEVSLIPRYMVSDETMKYPRPMGEVTGWPRRMSKVA